MKIIINKLSYLLLSFVLILGACDVEDSLTITTPDPEFTLDTPGISNVFLNFSLPDNPAFTISWQDEISGGSDYTVEMATDTEFTTPISLGNTTNSNFSMTVSDFNQAINNAGITTFRDVAIYMRVKTDNLTSNNILLLVTTYPVNAPAITGVSDGDSFVLSVANNDVVALTMGWNDPILDSSLNVDVEYVVEADLPGSDFANAVEVTMVKNTNSISLTNIQLNRVALEAGIPVDTAGDLEMRVRAIITDTNTNEVLERITSKVTINVTTYLTVLDLSSTWGIIGSAANDWGATPDLPFFKTDVDGVLVAYVNLIDGEIKFRENSDWANNYGGDSSTGGALVSGGSNIAVTAGSYKITMDLNNLTYSIESFSLGLVGSATENSWDGPDMVMQYDQYSDVFRAIVTLTDGEMKFRLNNDWGTNWGDDGVDGTADAGGANIVITAGNYIVTFDMKDLTYTLEKIDNIWGLVGSGAPNGWDGPDAQFTRDWSKPFNDIWILENVAVTAGEVKFRANNAWDINYGDNGNDGTLEAGGANIPTDAGTFTFVLDFSDPNAPTYTKN
ncbi:SusE domain-containing protein [Polaribacter septentrionalilitoris]|uniref:SusE domain-containing protein n=1 Tax=Polaribacter septentrionalilitoris TaxID=2494657 RepID=UPI001357B649|nr:SusE domain-containing protein [Polaribacter septentrionalilitoris]